ncbi:MAG: hypothetical protein NTY53_13045 [Kiritimatiellaeota bacterium]|nr:hypothetical protein [Kiritimatiellota bacterium]
MSVIGLGAFLVIGPLVLVFTWLTQAALLLLGAKLAGIEGRSFARCLGVTAIALVATLPAALLLSALPLVGGLVGTLAGFIVMAAAGCGIFRTTFVKALLAAVIAWLIVLGVGVILGALVMGALLVVG